ncbi:hypothetical protein ACPCBX_04400 [Streptomyces tuirus]|uniref:UL36 very large tegument protein n=1 Tax=Streptomyces tuirus TaxID=68278 RepID=A0A7G1NQT4_9ACTN|nr:hypothetical protein [Streptomyces tuirus]BCL23944.1 hypothetical protein GCM10017668_57870 [Streptomyces tuirus]
MAADQLPAEVGEFATYLDGLLARLDPSGGWCAVFWQRDPAGMRACLDGRDLPPWDVVEALLRDLAGQYGPGGAGPETERARALHAAALAVYDTRPGGRDALGDRLDAMLREQRYAAERQAALTRHLTSATTPEQADSLRLDLSWARDDHERAAARCAELRARMAHLDRRGRGVPPPVGTPPTVRGDGDGPHGAAPGSPTAAPQRNTPGSASTATGRSGTADPGAGWPGRQRFAGEGVSGEGHAGAVPDPAWTEVGRHAPSRLAARNVPGEADPGAGWPGRQHFAGEGVSGEGHAGAVPDPAWTEDGRHAPSRPAARSVPGEADPGAGWPGRRHFAGEGVSGEGHAGAVPDPAWTEVGRHAPSRPAARSVSGEAVPDGTPHPLGAPAPEPPAPEPPAPKPRKRRRGSARFAGMADEEAAPVAVPPAVVPTLPEPAPVATGRTPRGARFAGAADEAVVESPAREGGAAGAADLAEVGRTVDLLGRLRSEGRSGEAHALLAEVASWEPGRYPLLAERLHRAGLDADWQTLLWEAASLPAGRLVAAADALVEAGRAGDGQQMLRQGVARPPGEVGRAVLGLAAERRHREVRVLLDAYVRARTPEEAARSAEPDPRRLVPLLLEAAQGVSDERRWDLVHALRVAGFAA